MADDEQPAPAAQNWWDIPGNPPPQAVLPPQPVQAPAPPRARSVERVRVPGRPGVPGVGLSDAPLGADVIAPQEQQGRAFVRFPVADDSIQVMNRFIEGMIGAPVSTYANSALLDEEVRAIAWLSLIRPALLSSFAVMNDAYNSRDAITPVIRLAVDYHTRTIPELLPAAQRNGLIPQGTIGTPEYATNYYNSVFTAQGRDGDEKQRNGFNIIVQGGEAVNMYSMNSADNVPTHDIDTRIVYGNHFTYLTNIVDVDREIKLTLQRCLFLTHMLMTYAIKTFLELCGEEYLYSFFDRNRVDHRQIVTDILGRRFTTYPGYSGGGETNIYNLIISNQYRLDDDNNLARLRHQYIVVAGFNENVIDMFLPRKRMVERDRINALAATDAIHTFFGSEIMKTLTENGGRPYPLGAVPSAIVTMTTKPTTPWINGGRIRVRVAPVGYVIWDTLRMLFCSFLYYVRGTPYKFFKYKQKLACLLGTQLRTDISRTVFDITRANLSRNPEKRRVLTGGRGEVAVMTQPDDATEKVVQKGLKELAKTDLETTSEPVSLPTITTMDPTFLAAAREFSNSLWTRNVEQTEVFSDPVKMAGFMDYIGKTEGGFSDWRLPMEPAEKIVTPLPAASPEEIAAFKEVAKAMSTRSTPKGGTKTNRKTYRNQSSASGRTYRKKKAISHK